jgi:hypothetical protein
MSPALAGGFNLGCVGLGLGFESGPIDDFSRSIVEFALAIDEFLPSINDFSYSIDDHDFTGAYPPNDLL